MATGSSLSTAARRVGLLLLTAAALCATAESGGAEPARHDLMLALNTGFAPSGYNAGGDCRASSSSSSFMGTNCSYVNFGFAVKAGAPDVDHRISASRCAGDDGALTLQVESNVSDCRPTRAYGPMWNVRCYNPTVPGGEYGLNILLHPLCE